MPMAPIGDILNNETAQARREAEKREYEDHVREHGDGRPTVRYAALFVTPEVFAYMSSGSFKVIANPLPPDFRVVGAFYSEPRHAFGIVVESEEFEAIKAGDLIPELPPPVFTRLREGDTEKR